MKVYIVFSATKPELYLKVSEWLYNISLPGVTFESLERQDLVARKFEGLSQFISLDEELTPVCHEKGLFPASPINLSKTPFKMSMSIGRGIVVGPDAVLPDDAFILDNCIINRKIPGGIAVLPNTIAL